MQDKRMLLQRMLLIYVTFFVVLVAGIAHSLMSGVFSREYNEGALMGEEIMRSWMAGSPREIYLLDNVPLTGKTPLRIEGLDTLSEVRVTADVRRIRITVDRPTETATSPMRIALGSLGGNPWLYVLTMLVAVSAIAIVVLMFLTIHSIRRSIREERTLKRSNVWYLRAIGILTIFAELGNDFAAWRMKLRAAELLRDTQLTVDTSFTPSYGTIVMGLLILFTAEVFAIGHKLSEEQRLTI